MIGWKKLELCLKANSSIHDEYKRCISNLKQNDSIFLMDNYKHHSNVTCLEHSIYVSYLSYLVCRRLGFDYCSVARGGLLHDFFLYDWHIDKQEKGLHGFTHPYIALKNANEMFFLNDVEKDIIVKHMWPLTIWLPKYKESFIVAFIDKYCAVMEMLNMESKTVFLKLLIE